jgi:hypothetical protein
VGREAESDSGAVAACGKGTERLGRL